MSVLDVASWIALAAATVTGLSYLFKRARGGFRSYDQLEQLIGMADDIKDLLGRELEHNSGSSLKDNVVGIAFSLHRAHNRIDDINTYLKVFADANALVLPLISDAIHATPPPEEKQ